MPTSAILVTGAAGFIGAHVAARLRALGHEVVGCDNFNDYYDPALKRARVAALLTPCGVNCEAVDVADGAALRELFERRRPARVVHLAAQAGVRHSITHPEDYVSANLVGFANVLEAAKSGGVEHLVYASSSSVYGDSTQTPFHESQRTDAPVSLYAATKKANELMAHAYSHIHGMRCTGLRFFTVYGPWGRPDMAYFSFAQRLVAGEALPVFAGGTLQRDFTYIDDITEGVVRLALSPRRADDPMHEIFNIGNHQPVTVLEFIQTLSSLLGVVPKLEFLPMQPGDVRATCANVDKLRARVGFEPATPLREGLAKFVQWFEAWRTSDALSV
ncbi:MAG: NAD-dependent epimerase/dehydratase family protein [Burkholderiales bacterium]|nr:NAD-dependent epimerase/dehydratase family protein [Burkholderiales bacterium]